MQSVFVESMKSCQENSVRRISIAGSLAMCIVVRRLTLCFLTYLLLAVSSSALAQYQTLGPGSCGLSQNNCHTSENNWWKDDAHKTTVDAFYDDPESYEKIARLSGVGVDNMFKGNQLCMTCHGTVVSGRESRGVDEGVSCENCHGPGSGYKDPHQEGKREDGVNRAGYQKALKLGLVELKNLKARGQTCVRCHYITDQKLLAAGHPDGARFNYVSGIKKVAKHWQRAPGEEELNKAPFAAAMDAKGPIAQITKIAAVEENTSSEPPLTSTSPEPETGERPAGTPIVTTVQPAIQRAAPATPIRRSKLSPDSPKIVEATMPTAPDSAIIRPIELPPFPQLSDTMSVEQVLLIIKERLELLYDKTRR